jgi:hypothetical protein
MAMNPLAYTEKVVRSFLRYKLTTYPFCGRPAGHVLWRWNASGVARPAMSFKELSCSCLMNVIIS